MADNIYIPFELFEKLPKNESDSLRERLTNLYLKENPEKFQFIAERSDGDIDKLEKLKEEAFNEFIVEEYSFGVDILEDMKDDPIAQELAKEMNEFNLTNK